MTQSSTDLSSMAAMLAPGISTVGAGFMTDPSLFERGRQLGYQGLDFYIAGRAGVLGEVPAEVAAASLVFFEYTTVRRSWERSADVQTRSAAATDFAICAETWATSRLESDPRWERLALLAARLADAAASAHAPIFAGWRRRCPPDDPRLAMVHHLNSLREHRMACHASSVVANGLDVGDAVRYRQPEMVEVFGWSNSEDDPEHHAEVVRRWTDAERQTDLVVGQLYATLDDHDLDDFTTLVDAAQSAIGGRTLPPDDRNPKTRA